MKDANEYYGFTCSLSHFCPRISASVGVSCLPGKKCVSMFFYHIADDPCTARVSFLLLLIAAPHTHILSYNQLYFPPTNYIQFSELPRERFRFRDVSLGHHISFFFLSANSHVCQSSQIGSAVESKIFAGRENYFDSASAARPAVIIINNTFATASGENVNCFQRFASRARGLRAYRR
jgi:hypothetical protein